MSECSVLLYVYRTEDGIRPSYSGCWELNLGPLEGQLVLLTLSHLPCPYSFFLTSYRLAFNIAQNGGTLTRRGRALHTDVLRSLELLCTLWWGTGAQQSRRVFNMHLDNCVFPFQPDPPCPPAKNLCSQHATVRCKWQSQSEHWWGVWKMLALDQGFGKSSLFSGVNTANVTLWWAVFIFLLLRKDPVI